MNLPIDTAAIATFVDDLFGDVDEASRIVVAQFNPPRVSTARDGAGVARIVERNPFDVYFGLATMPATIRQGRGGAADTTGLGCVWLDIDCREGHHQSPKAYPPTLDDARAVVAAMPLRATYIVSTGGGLHAYWFFREFWRFDGPDDRERAAALSQGWQRIAHSIAAARGWVLDSTHDIARVLRVPGSYNNKSGAAKVAKIIAHNPDARHEVDDLIERCPATSDERTSREVAAVASRTRGVTCDMEAATRIAAPLMQDARFARVWRREPVRGGSNKSHSEWDFELAIVLCEYEFDDAVIANMIMAARAHHGATEKHDGYLPRTIARARERANRKRADDALRTGTAGVVVAKDGTATPMPDDKRRAVVLDTIGKALGVRIYEVIQFLGEPPSWKIVTEHGSVNLPSASHIINKGLFAAAMAEAANVLIQVEKDAWPTTAAALLSAVTRIELGEEATMRGAAFAWLVGYVRDMRHEEDSEKYDAALAQGRPIVKGGELCVAVRPLTGWVARSSESGIKAPTPTMISRHLREVGGDGRTVRIGTRTVRLYVIGIAETQRVFAALAEAKSAVEGSDYEEGAPL